MAVAGLEVSRLAREARPVCSGRLLGTLPGHLHSPESSATPRQRWISAKLIVVLQLIFSVFTLF